MEAMQITTRTQHLTSIPTHFHPQFLSLKHHQDLPFHFPRCPFHEPFSPEARQWSKSTHGRVEAPRVMPDDDGSWEFADEPVEDRSFDVKKAADECDLKGTSINLVGLDKEMNNKVGNVLAKTLGYYFFDSYRFLMFSWNGWDLAFFDNNKVNIFLMTMFSDSVVEDAAGSDPSGKSFRDRDEDGFREAESEVLKQLSAMGHLVVSAGNGAVQNASNLGYLRCGITIWIDVPIDMIAKRSNENQSEVFSRLVATYEEHKSGYATADATVLLQRVAAESGYFEYDQVTPEDMALEVFVELLKLTRVKKMMEDAGRPF
ncbi:putative inactive shikimate kinase like 1, chloroplastic [Drosera capensis]